MRKPLTIAILAVGLLSPLVTTVPVSAVPVPVSMAVAGEWVPAPYDPAGVRFIGVGRAFTPRRVFANVPIGEVRFNEKDGTTYQRSAKARKVLARSDGTRVQVRLDGKWVTVPYKWSPSKGRLVFEEQIARRLGLSGRDPLNPGFTLTINPNQTWVPDPPRTPTEPVHALDAATLNTVGGDWADVMLAHINAYRAEVGVAPVALCAPLTNAAIYKAQSSAANLYVGHATPNGWKPALSVIQDSGWPGLGTGENVGAVSETTAARLMNGWRNSPGHYAAMINTRYNYVGFGLQLGSDGRLYGATMLGQSDTC